jgi:hypothetical protein
MPSLPPCDVCDKPVHKDGYFVVDRILAFQQTLYRPCNSSKKVKV